MATTLKISPPLTSDTYIVLHTATYVCKKNTVWRHPVSVTGQAENLSEYQHGIHQLVQHSFWKLKFVRLVVVLIINHGDWQDVEMHRKCFILCSPEHYFIQQENKILEENEQNFQMGLFVSDHLGTLEWHFLFESSGERICRQNFAHDNSMHKHCSASHEFRFCWDIPNNLSRDFTPRQLFHFTF